MSASMMSAALRWPGLKATELVVYASLWDRADVDRKCWPTVEVLCLDHGFSRRAVISAIKTLAGLGLVRIQHRYKTSNVYHLLPVVCPSRAKCGAKSAPEPFPWEQSFSDAEIAPDDPCGAEIAPEPVSEVQNSSFSGAKTGQSEVQNLHTESPIESPIESPSTRSTESVASHERATEPVRSFTRVVYTATDAVPRVAEPYGFSRWWAAYPPCGSRPNSARRAYEQALRETTAEELLNGLHHYAFATGGPRWIIRPENWLRDQCWKSNNPDPERNFAARGALIHAEIGSTSLWAQMLEDESPDCIVQEA